MKKIISVIIVLGYTIYVFAQQIARVTVQGNSTLTISRHIYGHFAEHLGRCIYDGFYKDGKIRMDVVEALQKIRVPNLRWPGGCFADRYHWRDGIGPKDKRPLRVNSTWGMVPEENSFGTQEFLELCKLLNCEPYLAANMGTGSPQEMSDWIEYLNFNGKNELTELRKANGHPDPYHVSFWGIGNESWGCGGAMTPEYYSNLFKQYSSFCLDYPDAPLFKVASGPFNYDFNWTDVFMKNVPLNLVNGLSLHYYTIPSQQWDNKGSATDFTEREYFTTMWQALRMDIIISINEGIMNHFDLQKKVALVVDEWGVWTNVEPGTNPEFLYQQNSLRDALVAGSTLNIFNNHCERVRVACLAQTLNVLQSLILTDKDKMILTPTYHVFDLYKVHQDAKLLPIHIETPYWHNGKDSVPSVNVSASKDSNNIVHISLVNLDPNNMIKIRTTLNDISYKTVTGQILTSIKVTDINTFDAPNTIRIQKFTGAKKQGDELVMELPSKSVVVLELR
ncbi:MAG TPA: alpha-L-arabinofuranosidase C-terminal domain-containing protein [Puia sp.]